MSRRTVGVAPDTAWRLGSIFALTAAKAAVIAAAAMAAAGLLTVNARSASGSPAHLGRVEERTGGSNAEVARSAAAVAAPRAIATPPPDFVENRGQWRHRSRFITQRGALRGSLEINAIRLALGGDPRSSLGLVFEGARRDAGMVGEGRRQAYYNYFVGDDRARWRSRVPAYTSVLYRELYDHVDVRVRWQGDGLEYDLVVAPQARLERVVIRVEGASGLRIRGDGALIIETPSGTVRQTPPRTWEELPGGVRRPVESRFRKIDARRYGFAVSRRDPSLPLVIDPGLEWSTYLGGGDWDEIHDVAAAADGSGDVIVAGTTLSPDFSGRTNPVTGFVTRFSATGRLVYKTILGGSDREWIRGLAVAPSGEPVVVGESYSPDYPTTAGAYDTTHGVRFDAVGPIYEADAFVTRLSATGDRLVFSTFVGTNEYEQAVAVALAPSGAVILAGETLSPNWPTTAGAFDRTLNCCTPYFAGVFSQRDAFVARLSATGSALEYSTYLGGYGDELPKSIVVDAQGFVTVTGVTYSSPDAGAPHLPTSADALARNPVSREGISDAFLTRMKLDGSGAADLKYSTFLAGSSNEDGYAVALDPTNPADVIVGGFTMSIAYPGVVMPVAFPTTPGTLKPTSDSAEEGFVMRFRFPAAGGGSLVWSTLFGGYLYDEVFDLAVDPSGAIVIAGETKSFDLPTTPGAYDRTVAISSGLLFYDAYLARISADGSQVLYGTYLGGSYNDRHTKLALVGPNSVAAAGWTLSGDFPMTAGAHDPLLNNDGIGGVAGGPGGTEFDGFVARLTALPDGDGDDTVAAPALLSPQNGASIPTNHSTVFDWTDVADPSGIDGYHFQFNRRPDFICCDDWVEVWTSRSEHVTNARFGGAYYWRVQTADRSGNVSPWSEVRSFTTGPGISTVWVDPASVTGGSSVKGFVSISSPAPPGGTVVTLSTSDAAVATVPASVTVGQSQSQASFLVSTRTVTSSRSVSISASLRGTTRSAALTVNPAPAGPPPAPTLVAPGNDARVRQPVTFDWSDVAGAASYTIHIDDASGFGAPLVQSATVTASQFTTSSLPVKTLWWRVRARNSAGTQSAWSAIRRVTVESSTPPPPPPPPAALAAPNLVSPAHDARFSPGQPITFDWTDVSGAASYTIHIDDSDGFTSPLLVNQTTASSTFTTSSLPRATMWWRVRAHDSTGASGAWSSVRRVRTD